MIPTARITERLSERARQDNRGSRWPEFSFRLLRYRESFRFIDNRFTYPSLSAPVPLSPVSRLLPENNIPLSIVQFRLALAYCGPCYRRQIRRGVNVDESVAQPYDSIHPFDCTPLRTACASARPEHLTHRLFD